jgi:hypothetical protein
MHEQLWHTPLVCPGDGRYVWNDDAQTMESTLYGSPARPEPRSAKNSSLTNFSRATFGVTLENESLLVRMLLERVAAQH